MSRHKNLASIVKDSTYYDDYYDDEDYYNEGGRNAEEDALY